MIKDTHIRDDVQRELFYTPGLNAARIGVALEDGVVTLSGTVDNYEQKLAALRAAARIANVRAIACAIQVRLPGPRPLTDSDLAHAVANLLAWKCPVPSDRIRVRVENGWVTLEGTVDSPDQKEAAGTALAELSGIRGVDNLISVHPALDAEEIRRRIEVALRASPAIEDRNILVEVTNDKVVLHGEVRSSSEREEAEKIAWSMPGVADVADHIVIAEAVASRR
ncbi:MAG TPA: BON domain-containing protein [Bryobacteraceae bacterium]|nr:BON domain-containing protein [Bryobacteraceae bacterium]